MDLLLHFDGWSYVIESNPLVKRTDKSIEEQA